MTANAVAATLTVAPDRRSASIVHLDMPREVAASERVFSVSLGRCHFIPSGQGQVAVTAIASLPLAA